MPKRDDNPIIDSVEGFTDALPFSDDSVHTSAGSVSSGDVSGLKPFKNRQRRLQTYKYVLGDVYRLCLASDIKEAMLVFGATDPIRVGLYSTDSQLAFDLFRPHCVLISDFDGRVILEFPFK